MTGVLEPLIVGIGGGSGGGKTLLANLLCEELGREQCVILSLDSYYRNQVDMPLAVRGNFDHPQALDEQLFFDHLQQLRLGYGVDSPCYDFSHHRRTGESEYIPPRPFIFVDGVLLFALDGIFQVLDKSLFVDTAPDVRLARRLIRDVRERGRTLDSVTEQYLATVRPMHNRYVEPHKQRVDKIVSGEIDFQETLPDLLKYLKQELKHQQNPIHANVPVDTYVQYNVMTK